VRWFLPAWSLCFLATGLLGQQQEHRLIDRLLRPDLELQNSAQNKKANSALLERRGSVGTFFPPPSLHEKSFTDTHVLSTKQYSTRLFTSDARLSSSTEIHTITIPTAGVAAPEVRNLHTSGDANKSIATRDSADQRKFREQGQKFLNRQNPPLTIEQVRELLNKNK
jgi:hypothetical protein